MSSGNLYRRTEFGPFSILETRYPPNYRLPPHEDGGLRVSVVISGAVKEDSRGNEEFGSATSVVAKPGDVRHANVFGPQGAKILSIAVPDESILGDHTLKEWNWYHGGLISREAIRFIEAYRTESASVHVVEDYAYTLIGVLREGTRPMNTQSTPPVWLQRIRERLYEEFPRTYSVSGLARDADVHPVYLTRLFHRYFGCSVTRYVQRVRVHAAANSLASSDKSMAQIAFESGFSDQSHLCRTLKKKLGLSPRAFRSLMQTFNVDQRITFFSSASGAP